MNRYFEQQILSAEPLELVRLLYRRAIACVREAREHVKSENIPERCRAISRAYEALSELVSSLRAETAPDLVRSLREIYCYMQQRLLDANFQQSDPPLAETLGLLSTLAEAWDQIASVGHTDGKQQEVSDRTWYSQSLPGKPGQIAVSA